MRFLALAVLELEPAMQGLLCLEEPENGIHPARISSMLKLLQDIATDANYPVGPDNPLRQVIVNTHSPSVVRQVLDENLLVAELREYIVDDRRFKGVRFGPLPGTWGEKVSGESVSRGMLLDYLNPNVESENDRHGRCSLLSERSCRPYAVARVMDRPDMQQMLFRVAPEDE